jgi:hypothetical protein
MVDMIFHIYYLDEVANLVLSIPAKIGGDRKEWDKDFVALREIMKKIK